MNHEFASHNAKNQGFIDDLTARAAENGVTVTEKGKGHLHVKGTVLVNYWPFSKQQSAHVAGAKDSIIYITPNDVIRMALGMAPAAWVNTLTDDAMKRVMGPDYEPVVPAPRGGGRKKKAVELAKAMLPDGHPLKGTSPW